MVDFEIKSERYCVAAWSLPIPAIMVFHGQQVYRRALPPMIAKGLRYEPVRSAAIKAAGTMTVTFESVFAAQYMFCTCRIAVCGMGRRSPLRPICTPR
jgi:hypothetical protein